MESISLIDSFNLKVKCFKIFIIAILSIELTVSAKYSLPDVLSKSTMVCFLRDENNLLSCQKNSSTGANSGEYWGRNIHDHLVLLK